MEGFHMKKIVKLLAGMDRETIAAIAKQDMSRGVAARHDDAKYHLAMEAEVFSGAAGALIRCINDAIKVVVDRDHWPDIHMTEAEFKSEVPELLTIVEESLCRTIKNSSVDGVPAEQQNLVVDLMTQLLSSAMSDARKRLS
jgi:hypothetical protein